MAAGPAAWAAGARSAASSAARQTILAIGGSEPCGAAEVAGPHRTLCQQGWATSWSSKEAGDPRRRRRRRSKTALVLGGGGFTGGVYEIGALRALDLLAVDRTVNQFDVYVGTSAGSLIASLAANGVTPEQMMRVVNDQVPQPFRDVSLDMLLRPELPRVHLQGRAAAVPPARA